MLTEYQEHFLNSSSWQLHDNKKLVLLSNYRWTSSQAKKNETILSVSSTSCMIALCGYYGSEVLGIIHLFLILILVPLCMPGIWARCYKYLGESFLVSLIFLSLPLHISDSLGNSYLYNFLSFLRKYHRLGGWVDGWVGKACASKEKFIFSQIRRLEIQVHSASSMIGVPWVLFCWLSESCSLPFINA